MSKHAAITGATGFIGRVLCAALQKKGYGLNIITRNPENTEKLPGASFFSYSEEDIVKAVDGSYCIINLAGENIGAGLWTEKKKKEILLSRTETGEKISGAVRRAAKKPEVLIQSSAVGYYGNGAERMITENDVKGSGFLADVCGRWEDSTAAVEDMGVRRVVIRSGIVFGRREGSLPKMAAPFKMFLGAVLGRGTQWMPWIDIEDEASAIIYLAEKSSASGVFNLTSPGVISNSEFSYILGKILKKPVPFKIPAFVIRLFPGEMGKELLLSSLKVIPARLLDEGYSFKYPSVDKSLEKNLL